MSADEAAYRNNVLALCLGIEPLRPHLPFFADDAEAAGHELSMQWQFHSKDHYSLTMERVDSIKQHVDGEGLSFVDALLEVVHLLGEYNVYQPDMKLENLGRRGAMLVLIDLDSFATFVEANVGKNWYDKITVARDANPWNNLEHTPDHSLRTLDAFNRTLGYAMTVGALVTCVNWLNASAVNFDVTVSGGTKHGYMFDQLYNHTGKLSEHPGFLAELEYMRTIEPFKFMHNANVDNEAVDRKEYGDFYKLRASFLDKVFLGSN